MKHQLNAYGQPIGLDVPHWTPRPYPSGDTLQGRYCRLEHVDLVRHGDDLFAAYQAATDGRDWTYIPVGPFTDRALFAQHLQTIQASKDPLHYAVIDQQSGKALGTLSLMRIDPQNGVIEVGFVVYSPALKHTRIATEAQYLLMAYAFDTLGYRRYEWKCDALNAPSRVAAERLGFRFEGVFRNASIYKGRSRDTAWYSITDAEWPAVRHALCQWLDAANFDATGKQKQGLSLLMSQRDASV
ncbi:GNAT family N-acetyltransferase [Leeia oryzae]|uniref:GNAT family N-acetyltransferase n=1 Tax=Leeia oryzae TaxID=356662 RepID=UPI00037D046B|nr:GNAT family protein [Leeia oryzae]